MKGLKPIPRTARLSVTSSGSTGKVKHALAVSALSLASLTSLAFVAAPVAALFWLMQPTVRPNPGVAAYEPPLGTRLEPPVRSLASLDIAQSNSGRSLALNFARPYPQSEVAKDQAQPQQARESSPRAMHVANRQRAPRMPKRAYDGTAYAFTGDWYGQRQWNGHGAPRHPLTWH
jgi:hypothetical protein